jgi:hypothetical protein
MLNLKFLIPLIVAVTAPAIAPIVQAKSVNPIVQQAKCFKVKNNVIQVPRNINATQLETLKVIKVTKEAYEQIILNYSLENDIKLCLEQSKQINGFRIPMIMNKPGMVSFDSLNRYLSTATKFTVVDGNNKFTVRAKGYVDALFSEAKGYIVTSNMNRY